MAIPANWSTVTVTGQFLTLDGEAMEGTVRFSSTVRLVDAAEAVIVPASVVTATLDGTGSFSVLLPATDDPQVAPSFFYEVFEQLLHPGLPATTGAERTARQRNAKYLIQLPAADPTVDLADLTPVVDPVELSPLATKSYVDAADALLLPKAGGTITGTLDVEDRLRYAGFRLPSMAPRTRMPQRRAATTAHNMQTGHGWTSGGAGTASSDLNDTTTFIKGTQSIRVTTVGNGIQSQVRRTGLSAMDLTGKMIRLTFKIDDITNLDHINFYVGTTTFTNYFQWTFHTNPVAGNSAYVQSGEWVVVQLQWADITNVGGSFSITEGAPSTKTGFTDLQFAVYDKNGGAVTYHLQSVEIVPDLTNLFANGVVSVTFDDSWQSQFDYARPKMDALGYRGTLYTIADYIGVANRLTLAELRSMQNASGWEVAGHAYTNAAHGMPDGYADLTAEEVNEEFLKLKLWLGENGFTSDNFAYPKGHFDLTTDGVPVDQIAAQYWATSRTIISETKEAFPPAMPQRVKALTGVSDTAGNFWTPTKVNEVGGILDRCHDSGDWLIFCFHELTTGTPANSTVISQTGFNAVMDGIAAQGIPVLPVNDVIRYYT